ncbi:hypothetical protein ACRHK7_05560 [Weissella tructae]|uniref:Uncharacterized protein n=2 Tax=Weissella TaxID=46255 RepID=A0A075TZI0_9LACO|nr:MULTISPECIES: hypothetical protein [Weissella]AIG65691.1 hypothetical protein WS08_0752 [Weissella tructae]AIM63006.1 hypothetical protein WS74_0754 [Weissella ceti]AIM64406.1 hypothetical protein WS105_0816 [Weissella ceti]QVV90809.1 hypothetical protein KHQ32_04020 [Weissella tructae]
MDLKSFWVKLVNTNAVINHAEVGMKKKNLVIKKESKVELPTKKADEQLKKYKKNFMI